MWGSLIDYWYYTGDSSYNEIVQQGILHQAGDYNDFMLLNQSNSMGNDDQGIDLSLTYIQELSDYYIAFWAMTAMSTAELKFPDPLPDQLQ